MAATPDFLTKTDLEIKVGADTLLGLLSDSNGSTLSAAELVVLDDIMAQAENEAYSRLLRAYSKTAIILLAANDPALKGHIAWIALAFAAERRGAFLADDGRGAYQNQYDRAIKYFEAIAKAQLRSAGETVAGTTEQVGGTVQPTPVNEDEPFVFAPSVNNPGGSGGF